VSTQTGVVRLTERHIHADPPTQDEMDALVEDTRAIVATGIPDELRRAVDRAIGVAGTATSLGSIAQRLEPYDPKKGPGYVIARAAPAARTPPTPDTPRRLPPGPRRPPAARGRCPPPCGWRNRPPARARSSRTPHPCLARNASAALGPAWTAQAVARSPSARAR